MSFEFSFQSTSEVNDKPSCVTIEPRSAATPKHNCRPRQLLARHRWYYDKQIRRPGPQGWRLGAGLTIQPRKKVIVKKPHKGEEARAQIGL
jgi:hypothetical protein